MAGKPGILRKELAPTEHPTTQDICWAAGLYEGEGSVQYSPIKHSFTVRMPQKDSWVLYRMRALFGGTVREVAYKNISLWHVSGARARGLVMTIYKFLSPRRQEQVRRALEVK